MALAVAIWIALSGRAFAQEPASPPAQPQPAWSGNASAAWYMLPDESDYIQPTLRADRGWLHLETRYAYEDRESLSFFAGANFEFGKDVKLALTPMIGGLVGRTDGVVPALELDFTAWRVEAYAEAEYVVDLDETTSSYFYSWGEISLWATEWLRAGAVTQRTRTYRSERDIQRGALVGMAFSKVEGTFYLFNPGSDDQLAVLSVGFSF